MDFHLRVVFGASEDPHLRRSGALSSSGVNVCRGGKEGGGEQQAVSMVEQLVVATRSNRRRSVLRCPACRTLSLSSPNHNIIVYC